MINNRYIKEVVAVFKKNKDRYKAHELIRPIMSQMATDENFLYDVIRTNLSNPGYLLKKRHYSTLAMEIFQNSDLHFVMNIYPSLPDKKTDISFQNIHHHGNLLLTTVCAFGPGYSAFIFDKDFSIDLSTKEVKMKINRYYRNKKGNIEFIDAYTPHVVFYPESISATYALWSKSQKASSDILKQVSIIKKFKRPLTKAVSALGMKKSLGLNDQMNYDFYTENGKLYSLKERINYAEGSNENFIQNILSFIQQTGFNDIGFMKKIDTENISQKGKEWINKFIDHENIPEQFESIHLNVAKLNLNKPEIEAATGY